MAIGKTYLGKVKDVEVGVCAGNAISKFDRFVTSMTKFIGKIIEFRDLEGFSGWYVDVKDTDSFSFHESWIDFDYDNQVDFSKGIKK